MQHWGKYDKTGVYVMKNFIIFSLLLGLSLALSSCEEGDISTGDRTADMGLESTENDFSKSWTTLIGTQTFDNRSVFESAWNYYYPWGRDHNGSARMYGYPDHVYPSGGILTLTANRITWDEGQSSASPYPTIHYHSGAIHAKQHILVNDRYPHYEIKGEFKAPTGTGTWPSFWLDGMESWPPEIDIMEFKGDSVNWQNTFRTSSDVSTIKKYVPEADSRWHEYRVWIAKVSNTEVEIHFYIDDAWTGMHRANYVGKPLWIIINLQMEGSSGSPGPDKAVMQVRNMYVGRSEQW
jgi:hypothetical protein